MGVAPNWYNGMKFHEGIGFLTPGKSYGYVDMGPIPGLPDWHEQSKPSSYAFPNPESAIGFAEAHKRRDPLRYIAVRWPNGQTQEIIGDVNAA